MSFGVCWTTPRRAANRGAERMAMRFSDILIWSLTATVTAGLLFAV